MKLFYSCNQFTDINGIVHYKCNVKMIEKVNFWENFPYP